MHSYKITDLALSMHFDWNVTPSKADNATKRKILSILTIKPLQIHHIQVL